VAIRSTNTVERSVLVVDGGVGDVTDEEADVEGRGEQHEESEDHLCEIHAISQGAGARRTTAVEGGGLVVRSTAARA